MITKKYLLQTQDNNDFISDNSEKKNVLNISSSWELIIFPVHIFQRNTYITTLDLAGNEIGPDGAKYITEAMLDNETLTSLVRFLLFFYLFIYLFIF